MSDQTKDQAGLRAEAIVPPSPEDAGQSIVDARESLVHALAEDLRAGADHEVADEARLAKVEAQTRGLAEAVIAIANPQVTVAAVQAVKDEMTEPLASAPERIIE